VAQSSLQVLLQVMRETHNDVQTLIVSNAVLTEKVDRLEQTVEKLERMAERLEATGPSSDRPRPRSVARDGALAAGGGAVVVAILQAVQAFLSQPPPAPPPPAPAAHVTPK
jgi:K+/H+ antiporter YhaU regulatory subunit KhtT